MLDTETMKDTVSHTRKTGEIEISLDEILSTIKKYLPICFLAIVTGGVLGLLLSFRAPKMYTANITLLPEYKMSGSGSFFSMAFGGGNSGFDGAEKLTPELYPDILSATPFGLYLLKQPVVDFEGTQYPTYEDYIKKVSSSSKNSFSIFDFLKSSKEVKDSIKKVEVLDEDILYLDASQFSLVNYAASIVKCEVDPKRGTIIISSELEDPIIAAEVVEMSKKYLVQYVEDYRSSKVNQQYSFLIDRVKEAESDMKGAEYILQSYRDRNRDSYLNVSKIREQQLESEYLVKRSVYNDLVQKLEQYKVKEKEEKPVFKVLEPTRVPLIKSSPNRKLYVALSALLAVLITILYIAFYKMRVHKLLVNK